MYSITLVIYHLQNVTYLLQNNLTFSQESMSNWLIDEDQYKEILVSFY